MTTRLILEYEQEGFGSLLFRESRVCLVLGNHFDYRRFFVPGDGGDSLAGAITGNIALVSVLFVSVNQVAPGFESESNPVAMATRK